MKQIVVCSPKTFTQIPVIQLLNSIRMKKLLLLAVLAACMVGAAAQAPLKGYIIGIENGQVYLDYNSLDVKIGDRISIVGEASVFTHPVTKEKITKSGETIATVEITETAKDYSVAGRIFPANALAKLIVGQRAVIAAGAESFGKRYRTDSGLADGRNPLYEYPLGTFAGRQPTFVGTGRAGRTANTRRSGWIQADRYGQGIGDGFQFSRRRLEGLFRR